MCIIVMYIADSSAEVPRLAPFPPPIRAIPPSRSWRIVDPLRPPDSITNFERLRHRQGRPLARLLFFAPGWLVFLFLSLLLSVQGSDWIR